MFISTTLTGFIVACWMTPHPPEVFLAAVVGEKPFTDSIVVVSPDGSARTLLATSRVQSYTGVSAVSMAKPMVIQVNELTSDAVSESLSDYDPATKRLTPSCWNVAVKKGMGALSPDSKTYAFPNLASVHAGITFARCEPNGGTVIDQFTDPETAGDQAWYTSLAWFPDSKRLAAVKVSRGKEFRGIRMELSVIDVASHTRKIILGREDVVFACAVAWDDRIAVYDLKGVEVLGPTGERRTVLPASRLNGRRFLGGGIAWLNLSNRIVLGLVAPSEITGELWRIAADDGSVKILDKRKGFRFTSICSATSQPR